MVMYATPTELAGRLQKDLDTYTATQALTLASAEFSGAADTWFAAQSATYTHVVCGERVVYLPKQPATAVSEVRVNGVAVTGWTLVNGAVYRSAGYGGYGSFPPDVVAVDYTHGYTTVPDDVKRAVLDLAGEEYESTVRNVQSEQIDDYRITYFNGNSIGPGDPWDVVVRRYRPLVVA